MDQAQVATLSGIVRYPVKGLGGQALRDAAISRTGIDFDRAFGITHDRTAIEPFGRWTPFTAFHALDARPDMAGYRASVLPGLEGDRLELCSPSGEQLDLAVDEEGRLRPDAEGGDTIARWFATPTSTARLISSGSHLWDLEDAPISIINLATLAELSEAAGAPIDHRRFRANLYVDGLAPWAELTLPGQLVRVGECVLEILRPIERCRAITVDPDSASTDVNLLAILASKFGHLYCGTYATVVTPGVVALGDAFVPEPTRRRPRAQDLSPRERAVLPRRATVVAVESPTPETRSLEIADATGFLGSALAGQHLRLHRIDAGHASWRNYTVSKLGADGTRVTVALQQDGVFSPWVHRLKPGDEVIVSGPHGTVGVPDDDGELLLLTAGIGITPALAIVSALAAAGSTRVVRGIHVARDRSSIPHLDELRDGYRSLDGDLRVHLTQDAEADGFVAGRPGTAAVADAIDDPGSLTAIICGPVAFEREMRGILEGLGVAPERVKSDPFYSPRDTVGERHDPPSPGPHRITLVGAADDVTVEWVADSGSILDVAEAAGLSYPASCRAGACGTCAMRVDRPVAYLIDPVIDPEPGTALICCAVPVTDVVVGVRR